MRWVVLMAVLLTAVIPAPATAAGPIGGGARPARRPVATCPGSPTHRATSRPWPPSPRGTRVSRQFVVLATSGFAATTGTAFVAARGRDGVWRCQTDTVAASFGSKGTRVLADRRSGDDTTPAGVFPLGKVTAWDGQTFSVFGNSPDPGVRSNVTYRSVRNEDCWGATPGASSYNHLVNSPNCPGPDDEWLPRFGDVYSHAAVIGANLDPVSGDAPGETPFAAAIFLHRNSYTAPANRSRRAAACRSPTSTSSRSSASSTRRSPRNSPSARPATSCRTRLNNLRTHAAH